jgi:hypothetical protein
MDALQQLRSDMQLRTAMAAAARRHVAAEHHPARIAEQYFNVIETCFDAPERIEYRNAIRRLTRDVGGGPTGQDLTAVAACLASNRPRQERPQLLIDVSGWEMSNKGDLPVVLRDALDLLLRTESVAMRVEPVYRRNGRYRYAIAFTCRFLLLSDFGIQDEIADCGTGDQILILPEIYLPETDQALIQASGARILRTVDQPG